jgi:hypothetical protein
MTVTVSCKVCRPCIATGNAYGNKSVRRESNFPENLSQIGCYGHFLLFLTKFRVTDI